MEDSPFSQRLWKRFGFVSNPFDTTPLSFCNRFLPIGEALVGRGMDSKETRTLTSILQSPGGARVMVEGKIGVGKTTFVNYHRYLWENHAQDLLFTTKREISVTSEWRLPHFLMNTLAAILAKLIQEKGEKEIKKNPLFSELLALNRVSLSSNYSFQAFWRSFGGGFGKGKEVNVPPIPEMQLLEYLEKTVEEIRNLGYAGLFLHFDNLELLSQEDFRETSRFFEEIRDSLQIADVYFIFVARQGFFREIISPLERVRSIFYGRAITVPPLSKSQALEAIHLRYSLLSLRKSQFIPPVESTFIEYLYDLYQGKLRYIMDAINLLSPLLSRGSPKTLPFEGAKKTLAHLVQEEIQGNLTPREWQIFHFCVQQEEFTNRDVQREFSLPSSNSSRFLQRLLSLRFIYLDRKEGKHIYYKPSEFATILREKKERKTQISISSLGSGPKKKDRLKKGMELIEEAGEIAASDYSKLMRISPATASRDLSALLQAGKVSMRKEGKLKLYRLIG